MNYPVPSRSPSDKETEAGHQNEPIVQEDYRLVSLGFDYSATQSMMHKSDPDCLVLGYTRTMMGFLLFHPKPKHIAMIGLGGGSLAKYCRRHLPDAQFTAVEINPEVIALRDRFHIPPDGPGFQVLCADGAEYVRENPKTNDVLLLDGFNRNGQAEELCTTRFYDHCYANLRNYGVLVVNLLNSDARMDAYISRIQTSFDDQVIVVDAEKSGNKILFAYKGDQFPRLARKISERARRMSALHDVSLNSTAHKLIQKLSRLYVL
ncbi:MULTISPECIES: transferase [Acidithiobacillus]|jgi:spermidine synthase|uniref:Transferase n=1 Tax=Acidithiobacillus thiooxidans ATCC 19377 TaxID=637390 RepID=A0A5P9XVY9_ACITH|nr:MULTISPECIES: transferase [Acidithiobacillus]MBU2740432.1 transferase [Acidithiobacillus albertensis]MBU2834509.1 transferase [Acidithiobacillus thiooxidans]MBU2841188.1 transferase [Acidithiobacillus thiooxidans]MDA8175814.1 transferase [Acidithiobacillus sp.]QFX97416.1 transferase [Acidithiobacillus thiooxidans ATCC 19377]